MIAIKLSSGYYINPKWKVITNNGREVFVEPTRHNSSTLLVSTEFDENLLGDQFFLSDTFGQGVFSYTGFTFESEGKLFMQVNILSNPQLERFELVHGEIQDEYPKDQVTVIVP